MNSKDELIYKLDPELKSKWLKALRSGKYMQGRGRLCSLYRGISTYCCLGVLADVIDPKDWESFLVHNSWKHMTTSLSSSSDIDKNTYNVLKQVSTNSLKTVENHLIFMNDSQGKTFPEIADWIEQNL